MTTLEQFLLTKPGATGPHSEDKDGWLPLHHAIQATKHDPKLLEVTLELIAKATPEDTSGDPIGSYRYRSSIAYRILVGR